MTKTRRGHHVSGKLSFWYPPPLLQCGGNPIGDPISKTLSPHPIHPTTRQLPESKICQEQSTS